MNTTCLFDIPESWARADSHTGALDALNLPVVETVSLEDKNN